MTVIKPIIDTFMYVLSAFWYAVVTAGALLALWIITTFVLFVNIVMSVGRALSGWDISKIFDNMWLLSDRKR